MKALVGEINDSVYLSFSLGIEDGITDGSSNAKPYTNKKEIVTGSSSREKGFFIATQGDETFCEEGSFAKYKDILNSVEIFFHESDIYPLVKISISLPNPDKYVVSEFFLLGHICFSKIDITSEKKTVNGDVINENLANGKKFNILSKIFIERKGDPKTLVNKLQTSIGELVQYRNNQALEI